MDDLQLWQLVAVVIATLFLSSVCMIGLWSLFHKDEPDNYQSPSIRDNVKKVL